MPYTPSTPTGDSISGADKALSDHVSQIHNVERGSDVQRRIMSGYDSSGNRKAAPSAPDSDPRSVLGQQMQAIGSLPGRFMQGRQAIIDSLSRKP